MNPDQRRRLVAREIAVGDRQKEAIAVARADRADTVDQVYVDFRHPDIPAGEWEAREFWHVGADSLQHCGFLFPSEAHACLRESRDEHEQELIAEKLALPRAYPGDKLTVEAVIDRISDRRFDHRHDATIKEASLILTRPNGDVFRPSSPMRFYGITQLRDGPPRDAYDRLASRILSEHNWPDPEKFETERRLRPDEGPWVEEANLDLSDRAARAIENCERAWHKLVDQYFSDDSRGRVLLRTALAEAVRAAFFQAKHESNRAEQRASAQLDNLSEGSRTRKNWERIAVAKRLAASNPDWRRNRIATGVIAELGLDEKSRSPLLRTLKNENIGPDPS